MSAAMWRTMHHRIRSPIHARALRVGGAAAAVWLAGCHTDAGHGRAGAVQQAIAGEHEGGVAQLAPRFYTSADVTRAGYAVAEVGGCTGSMIGPNIMLTAAHC